MVIYLLQCSLLLTIMGLYTLQVFNINMSRPVKDYYWYEYLRLRMYDVDEELIESYCDN